jgi:hypothetical protein
MAMPPNHLKYKSGTQVFHQFFGFLAVGVIHRMRGCFEKKNIKTFVTYPTPL